MDDPSLSWASPVCGPNGCGYASLSEKTFTEKGEGSDGNPLQNGSRLLAPLSTPRGLRPMPCFLKSPSSFMGLEASLEYALMRSRYGLCPLRMACLPLLWPSVNLQSDSFARILGHRDKWCDTLPTRLSDPLQPSKLDPFLRFFSLVLIARRIGRSRSQTGKFLKETRVPAFHPIPSHSDLISAFSPAEYHRRSSKMRSSSGSAPPVVEDTADQDRMSVPPRPGQWPEAVQKLGISWFRSERNLSPTTLLRALPAFTTADLTYLVSLLYGKNKPSILSFFRHGASVLSIYLNMLRTGEEEPSDVYRKVDPISCNHLLSYTERFAHLPPSNLPLIVRSGLPPALLLTLADFFDVSRTGDAYSIIPDLIGISSTTLQRRIRTPHRYGCLAPQESDIVLRFLILIGTAEKSLPGFSAIQNWFHGVLSGPSPLALIRKSPIGLSSALLTRLRRSLLSENPPLW